MSLYDVLVVPSAYIQQSTYVTLLMDIEVPLRFFTAFAALLALRNCSMCRSVFNDPMDVSILIRLVRPFSLDTSTAPDVR